jgi:hypothetical protein
MHDGGYGGWKGSEIVITSHFLYRLAISHLYVMVEGLGQSIGPMDLSVKLQGGLKTSLLSKYSRSFSHDNSTLFWG